jgi:erythromycin esterase
MHHPTLDTSLLNWLRKHTISVAGVSSDTKGIADLLPLKAAIGKARIVMLGEGTHGDGTTFEAKVRLIKFLHAQMGFEVLVWESGLYDCETMNQKLFSDEPLQKVASMGVFGHWATGQESFPVFEYARNTKNSPKPLLMTGFDIQNSGVAGNTQYQMFAEWLSQPSMLLSSNLQKRLTDNLQQLEKAKTPESYATISRALRATARELLALVEKNEKTITKQIGAREFAYRRQCLKSAAAFARMMDAHEIYQKTQQMTDFATGYNLREKSNAENLLWLLSERYPNKKLIVWAHNSHIFSGFPATARTEGDAPKKDEIDSMGRLVKRKLGDLVYSIGFLAHSGQWSWMGNTPIDYTVAEEDSIENSLHQVGKPYLFLDLRAVKKTPKNPLNRPIAGCINRQSPEFADIVWPKAYDGLFFIDTMKPRIQRKSKPT